MAVLSVRNVNDDIQLNFLSSIYIKLKEIECT